MGNEAQLEWYPGRVQGGCRDNCHGCGGGTKDGPVFQVLQCFSTPCVLPFNSPSIMSLQVSTLLDLCESNGLVSTLIPSAGEGRLLSTQFLGLDKPGSVCMPSFTYSPPGLSLGLKAMCFAAGGPEAPTGPGTN